MNRVKRRHESGIKRQHIGLDELERIAWWRIDIDAHDLEASARITSASAASTAKQIQQSGQFRPTGHRMFLRRGTRSLADVGVMVTGRDSLARSPPAPSEIRFARHGAGVYLSLTKVCATMRARSDRVAVQTQRISAPAMPWAHR